MDSVAGWLKFIKHVGDLKRQKRTGWTRYPTIKQVESVSEHSHRCATLTLLFHGQQDIDVQRATQIAIVHDLAESIIGDITPYCQISKQQKKEKEDQAFKELIDGLDPYTQQFIWGLYQEYENDETKEAQLVKDLDKFEMLCQAQEYEVETGTDLQDFYSCIQKIRNPRLQLLCQQIQQNKVRNGDQKL